MNIEALLFWGIVAIILLFLLFRFSLVRKLFAALVIVLGLVVIYFLYKDYQYERQQTIAKSLIKPEQITFKNLNINENRGIIADKLNGWVEVKSKYTPYLIHTRFTVQYCKSPGDCKIVEKDIITVQILDLKKNSYGTFSSIIDHRDWHELYIKNPSKFKISYKIGEILAH